MANSRYYSSVALPTTLTGGIGPSNTTINVASTAGFPGSLPYTLALDYGASNEELVEVTAVGGLSLTVTRAIDSTAASTHNIGAVVRHVSSARDFTDSRTHEAASTNVHGLSGGAAVVGTTSSQTLTNKTLTRATGSLLNINMFNTGTNTTAIIGDSTNPTVDRLQVLDNEVSLNAMIKVNQVGAIYSIKTLSDLDTTYRFRVTDNDGTTDRWYALSGGTMSVRPTTTTTQTGIEFVAPDTSITKRAIRIAAAGGTTERLVVYNDGHVELTGTSTATTPLTIAAPASHATFYIRVRDNANNLFYVDSTKKAYATGTFEVSNANSTVGASAQVLRVIANTTSQTGNLQEWIDQSSSVVASVSPSGALTTSGLTVNGIGQTLAARKTADTTRTSTTTATDDPHLVVAVSANSVYELNGYVIYNANTTGDIGIQFGVPAGTTGSYSGVGWGRDAGASVGTGGWTVRMNENSITQNRTFGGDTTDITIHVKGVVVTAGSAGNFSLQWAQAASDPGGTIVRTNSYITLRRIA